MRTTITLDPDVEALVKKTMKTRGTGFKQTVNDALRQGLRTGPRASFDFPTFDMGTPRVDLVAANRVAEELEDQALLLKAAEGR
jgi:hypothetical protein